MWKHSGVIFINAARVYYLLDDENAPPLLWQAETQRFVYMSAENGSNDAMIRASLLDVVGQSPSTSSASSVLPLRGPLGAASAKKASGPFLPSVDAVSNRIVCECIYGVLPLGYSSSVLLYVTEKYLVTSLALPERERGVSAEDGGGALRTDKQTHDVFLVRKLEWMMLPSRAPRSESHLATPMTGSADAKKRGTDSLFSDDDDEAHESICDEVLEEYLRVIDEFCLQVSHKEGEHSYLYYSPTVNLALSPEELLQGKLHVQPDTLSEQQHKVSLSSLLPPVTSNMFGHRPNTRSDEERDSNSRTVFQWNHMLLKSFHLPSNRAEMENQVNLAASSRILRRGGSAPSSPSASGACIDEGSGFTYPWSCVHMTDAQGNPTFNATMLYVPCFIRGTVVAYDIAQDAPSTLPRVELHLITRLSCRWAGTRYNRRGLEPTGSGAVANCAVSSLWVSTASSLTSSPRDRESESSPLLPHGPSSSQEPCRRTERVAVLNLVRGSVPRRWEQPADLHFKPPLKVLFPHNGAEEVIMHLQFLRTILHGVQKVACIDTTSTSWLEGPLSEAFANAVEKVQKELQKGLQRECQDGSCEDPLSDENPKHAPTADSAEKNQRTDSPRSERSSSTPLSYMKFNMKAKLKKLRYGALCRDVASELRSNQMGIYLPGASSAEGETEDIHQGSASQETPGQLLLPPWVDFTQCQFMVSNGEQCRSTVGATPSAAHQRGASAVVQRGPPRLRTQGLYYRVNCLDCLDRTNLMQAMLAQNALPYMLQYVLDDVLGPTDDATASTASTMSMPDRRHTLEKLNAVACAGVRLMFAQQGIAVSQMYANSEAHFIPFLLGRPGQPVEDNNEHTKYSPSFEEGALALRRWFFQNFRDGKKQDSVSLVTLQHDPSLYPSDIESPFSRDLSSMNRLVVYGVLCALLPFVFSILSYFFSSSRTEKRVHVTMTVAWMAYFIFLYQKLSKYRVSYTNQPLLSFTVN